MTEPKERFEDYVTPEQLEKAVNSHHEGKDDNEDDGTLDLVDMFEDGAWEEGLDKYWG
jgi:hypothetical protein